MSLNLLDLISHAVLVVDSEGRVSHLNKAAESLLSRTTEAMAGSLVDELVAKRDRHRLSALRKRVTTEPAEPAAETFIVVASNGSEFPAEVRLTHFAGDAGSQGIIEIRDLTEQRKYEAQLAETKERFDALRSTSTDWYWQQDSELRFTYFSRTDINTNITDPHNAIGKTRFEIPCVFMSEKERAHHARILAERKPFRNLLLHNPDNDRWALVSGDPIFDSEGVFCGYHGIALDLTSEKRAERALRESESRFRALSAMSNDWYWEQDADLRFTRMTGVTTRSPLNTLENVKGRKRTELPYIWGSLEARIEHEELLTQRKPFRDLLLHNPANGRYALTSGDPLFDEHGRFRGYHGVSRDITEQIHAERALRKSESRFRSLTALTSDWYWEQDENLRFIYMSPTGQSNGRIPINRIIGHTRFELPVIWESEAVKQEHIQILENRLPFHDLLLRTEANDQYLNVSGEPVFDDDGQFRGYQGVTKDVTRQKNAEAKAVHLATHDALTGLPNRTLLVDRLQHAIAQAERSSKQVAVMFIDIDRFKLLNDSFGHSIGDAYLKTMSSRLESALRRSDTLARFGGDEMVVVLEHLRDDSDAKTIADKIQATFSEIVDLNDVTFQTTASIGVSLFPRDGKDSETLLRHADLAMYEAKESGRGRTRFFNDEMNRRVAIRTTLDHQLRHAIENREFELYFHPQHKVSDDQFIGAEVLLRWNHPERGVVTPNDFIFAAEDSGLIVPIGRFVIENTFSLMSDWLRMGTAPARLAVNISARQLEEGAGLVADIRRLLDAFQVPPERIEFEITESLLIPTQEESGYNILRALGRMGFKVAIDDFGTGYSSLSYLKQLASSAIKIDRAFIDDIATNEESVAIVRSVIGLARHLKMEVVSEGVETEEQLKVLQHIGCDSYQGFLRSEPMPRHEFEQRFLGMHRSDNVRSLHPRNAARQ